VKELKSARSAQPTPLLTFPDTNALRDGKLGLGGWVLGRLPMGWEPEIWREGGFWGVACFEPRPNIFGRVLFSLGHFWWVEIPWDLAAQGAEMGVARGWAICRGWAQLAQTGRDSEIGGRAFCGERVKVWSHEFLDQGRENVVNAMSLGVRLCCVAWP